MDYGNLLLLFKFTDYQQVLDAPDRFPQWTNKTTKDEELIRNKAHKANDASSWRNDWMMMRLLKWWNYLNDEIT